MIRAFAHDHGSVRATAFVLLCGIGLTGAVAPQVAPGGAPIDRTGVDQVAPASPGEAIRVEQVGTGTRILPVTPRPVRTAEAATQVGRVNDRTTTAPPSGSSRADGRPTAAVAIGGTDRCDPQAAGAANAAACANPIETRAGQYRAPDPTTLSPEQRLAAARRAGDAGTVVNETARLAKAPDAQLLNTTEQGVASIVLNAPTAPGTPTAPDAPTLQIDPAALDAVIQLLGVNVPPR